LADDRLVIEPEFREAHAAAGLDSVESLADPALGETVVSSSTTRTARVVLDRRGGGPVLWVKTYRYPTWRHRFRGAFRTTFGARGRAASEWANLALMPDFGFGRVRRAALGERRVAGFLALAVLATEEIEGALGLDAWLARESKSSDRQRAALRTRTVLDILAGAVARMHREGGFIDRNLDRRNILVAQPRPGGFVLYNIDSPRGRVVRGHAAFEKGWREDLARLDVTSDRLLGLKSRARFLKTYLGPAASGWRRTAAEIVAAEAKFARRAAARFEESVKGHASDLDEDKSRV